MKLYSRNIQSSKKKTLSNSLRNRLIFTVSAIFIVTTFSNYWLSSHRSKVLNSEKESEYLIYFGDNLEVPLWNMDKDWIKSICRSFANNEMIGLLKVVDGDGRVLFQKSNKNELNLKTRKSKLYVKGYYIGSIELALSEQFYKRQNDKMLLINALTMILVIIGIAFSTKLILNEILEKPISHLLRKIDAISKGEYDDTSKNFNHFEIITILKKFNRMSSKVKNREISLMETNKKLALEIAGRKKVEKAHQASEERYRQLVEDLTVGLFRSSAQINGSFMMVNQALVKMLGYESKETLLKKSVASIYKTPAMRAQFLDILFKQSEIQGFEHEFIKKDGTLLVGLSTCHVSRDKDGTPLYIDGIIEDITHRKHLEKQIKQTQKLEALGTLAGGIAHDFNNILSSIFGFTEVAKIRYASGKKMNDSLDEILNAGIRARGLIKQILTFSRQSDVKRVAITINPIIKETIKFLRASLPAMIEIRYDFKKTDNIIWGDPTQIHQILMNLCTNSAHAMENGGILEITLDNLTIDDKSGSDSPVLKPGDYIRLKVEDTGHGIKKEYADRIFEPFFTTKHRGEGTGMGLSVVHGIVTEMGGEIFMESSVGEGSCFSILIPAYIGEPDPLSLSHDSQKIGMGKILFVDDEGGFLKSGTEILTEHGYDVMPASSGQEAIGLLQSAALTPDLVITDLDMPKMTGLELALRLKRIKPDIPIILCTGFSGSICEKSQKSAGISEVVMKPILANELISAVKNSIKLKID